MTDAAPGTLERYEARMALYRSLGYDRLAAVRGVVDRLGPLHGDVLDVGTGQGLLAIELARRGAAVTSIDASPGEQRIGIANAGHQGVADRITFVAADARAIPFRDRSFGLVAMLDALHHLEDGPAVFSELQRVLSPGGTLLLAEMTPDGLALIARVHASEGRVHPVGPVTFETARQWLTSRGFQQAAFDEVEWHFVAVLAKPRGAPARLHGIRSSP